MKHHYRMHISVSTLTTGEITTVLEIIGAIWNKPEMVRKIANKKLLLIETTAEGYLTNGESEEAFAERISLAIWRSLRRFVKVSVDATYLEEPPNDSYEFGERDYQRLVGAM